MPISTSQLTDCQRFFRIDRRRNYVEDKREHQESRGSREKGSLIQEENELNVSEEVKEEERSWKTYKQEKELEIDEVESLKNEIRVLKDETPG